jgi:hypothetical protein
MSNRHQIQYHLSDLDPLIYILIDVALLFGVMLIQLLEQQPKHHVMLSSGRDRSVVVRHTFSSLVSPLTPRPYIDDRVETPHPILHE